MANERKRGVYRFLEFILHVRQRIGNEPCFIDIYNGRYDDSLPSASQGKSSDVANALWEQNKMKLKLLWTISSNDIVTNIFRVS